MTLFMTVCGDVSPLISNGHELIPLEQCHQYLVNLISVISTVDGSPIFLVSDRETGSSDLLVSALYDAVLDEADYSSLDIYELLKVCFEAGINFRLWGANNNLNAWTDYSIRVSTLQQAVEGIGHGKSIYFHAC